MPLAPVISFVLNQTMFGVSNESAEVLKFHKWLLCKSVNGKSCEMKTQGNDMWILKRWNGQSFLRFSLEQAGYYLQEFFLVRNLVCFSRNNVPYCEFTQSVGRRDPHSCSHEACWHSKEWMGTFICLSQSAKASKEVGRIWLSNISSTPQQNLTTIHTIKRSEKANSSKCSTLKMNKPAVGDLTRPPKFGRVLVLIWMI